MTPTISLVVVAANSQELGEFGLQHVIPIVDELILLSNPGGVFGGLGKIGNHYINHARGDVLGIVHADTVFGPGAIAVFAAAAIQGSVAGMHGRTIEGKNAFSQGRPAEVSTLDSCSVFFRRSSNLRFDDKTFDSFHCCVEDFCLEAGAKKCRIVVPQADAKHLSVRYNSKETVWRSKYSEYRTRLNEKWKRVKFAACDIVN